MSSAAGTLSRIFADFAPPPLNPVLENARREMDLVCSILKFATTDSTTPEQRAAAQVQEAQRQVAEADEERRRAFFTDPTLPKY